jgi:hypothetical protein
MSASSLAGTNGTLGRAPAHPYPARTHRIRTARASLGLGVMSLPAQSTFRRCRESRGFRHEPTSRLEFRVPEDMNVVHPFAPRLPARPRQGPAWLRSARPASPSAVGRPSLVRPRCIRPTYATHVSKTSTRSTLQCRVVRDCSRGRRTVCFTSPGPLRRPSFRRSRRCRPTAPVVASLRPFERLAATSAGSALTSLSRSARRRLSSSRSCRRAQKAEAASTTSP